MYYVSRKNVCISKISFRPVHLLTVICPNRILQVNKLFRIRERK